MTLPRYALYYKKYSREELRGFVMRRENLSGREYRKTTKHNLVKRLHRLDEKATFRFMEVPPELREHIYEHNIGEPRDLRALLLTSRLIHKEAESLFYKKAKLRLSDDQHLDPQDSNPLFNYSVEYRETIKPVKPILDFTYLDALFSWQYMLTNFRHLSISILLFPYIPVTPQRRCRGLVANRILFMICVFFATTGKNHQLRTIEVKPNVQFPPGFDTYPDASYMFWPLKLLPNDVVIDYSALPAQIMERLDLSKVDVGLTLTEAYKRFANFFFVAGRPVKPLWVTSSQAEKLILEVKKKEWEDYKDYILPSNGAVLTDFLDLVENLDAEHRNYIERSLSTYLGFTPSKRWRDWS